MENLLYLYGGIILSIFLANKNEGSRIELVIISMLSIFFFVLSGSGTSPIFILLAFILPSFGIARRFNAVGVNKWNALWCFTGIYSFFMTCQLIFNSDYNSERSEEKKNKTYSKAYYIETVYGLALILITILLVVGLIFVRVWRAQKSF